MNFHVIVPCDEDSREGDLPGLFEFHRSCRLRCKIIQHAVNSRNLVLEQNPNRLHQLEIHIFWQSARIVVCLDAFLRFFFSPDRLPRQACPDNLKRSMRTVNGLLYYKTHKKSIIISYYLNSQVIIKQ